MGKIINIFRKERANSSNALLALIMIVLGLFQANQVDVSQINPQAVIGGSVVALINLIMIISKNLSKIKSEGGWSWRYLYSPNALIQWISFAVGALEYFGAIPATTAIQVAGALQTVNFGGHVINDDFLKNKVEKEAA